MPTNFKSVSFFYSQAAEIVRLMIKNMPSEVFVLLARSNGVGLFSASEGVTIYPENRQLADRPECYGKNIKNGLFY